MEAKIEVNAIKLTQKLIDHELALQSSRFHKALQRKLSEKALHQAFQLDTLGK